MRKRVDISSEQVQLLQQMADYEGHGNINAALGTLIKFGLPLYMSSRGAANGELTPVLTQKESTARPTEESGSNAVTKTTPTAPAFDAVTLAESLGFRYSKSNSSQLVEEALARRDDYCVERPGYAEVTDEAVLALAGVVDSF